MPNGIHEDNKLYEENSKTAEKTMKFIEELIKQEAQASGKKKNAEASQERMRKILTATSGILSVIELAAQANPIAQAAVVLFRSLLTLEQEREENAEQIVAVFHTMSSMIFVLKFIRAHMFQEDRSSLKEQFEKTIGDIDTSMRNFGLFTNAYYVKYGKLSRFIRAKDIKEKLATFSTVFKAHKDELQILLHVNSASQVQQISDSIQQIIERLGQPTTVAEERADQIIKKSGGPHNIVNDPKALAEVARLLGDIVMSSTRELLTESLDELMNRNLERFTFLLCGAEKGIEAAIERSRNDIFQKLDVGPHDVIENEIVKDIWKANGWRLSVKSHPFVDAIHEHYGVEFRKQAADYQGIKPPGAWTLPILSKIIYHPAIGDAIDKDGSGFISVHRLNRFLKSIPVGLSIPEWLAYWAIGLQYTNMVYTAKISRFLKLIRRASKATMEQKDKHHRAIINGYLDMIHLVKILAKWTYYVGDGIGTADVSYAAGNKVEAISNKQAKARDAKVVQNLEAINFAITHDRLLSLIVDTDYHEFRIEHWITCLLFHILRKHHKLIKGAKPGKNKSASQAELTDTEWNNMHGSLLIVITAFHYRMKELLRGWYSQKIDVEVQIETFSAGVFASWFQSYDADDGEVNKFDDNAEDAYYPDDGDYNDSDDLDDDAEGSKKEGDSSPESSSSSSSSDDDDDDNKGDGMAKARPTKSKSKHADVSGGIELRLESIEKILEKLLRQENESAQTKARASTSTRSQSPVASEAVLSGNSPQGIMRASGARLSGFKNRFQRAT